MIGYTNCVRRIEIMTKFRRIIYKLIRNELKKEKNHKPGSSRWLIAKEIQFGGYEFGIKEKVKSKFDSRVEEEFIKNSGMSGGDRMLINGYSKYYEKYLEKYLNSENLIIVEIGILKGIGLAIWSELFPRSRIIGFDLDISNCEKNMDNMITLGAFKYRKPELYTFDQFENNSRLLNSLFKGKEIDIFIDDGEHSNLAIINTFRNVFPFLSENFIYFIEDNRTVSHVLKKEFKNLEVINHGSMTIIKPFLRKKSKKLSSFTDT